MPFPRDSIGRKRVSCIEGLMLVQPIPRQYGTVSQSDCFEFVIGNAVVHFVLDVS